VTADVGGGPPSPVLAWLEVRGFRAFGTKPRRLELDTPLSVVHGRNSQGKSSLAEAVEFLLTGRSSRRDLLGGAKSEYNESLRNVHLPEGDQDVWVAAGLRKDGNIHEVRRKLVSDFGQGSECKSVLLIDGIEQPDLAAFGLAAAPGSAVGAPVLLQHTLRHVLSTEPKQRVAYFKSLLSLTDLDALRDRVASARRRFENQPTTEAGRSFLAWQATPFGQFADALRQVIGGTIPHGGTDATALVHTALLKAGDQALGRNHRDVAALRTSLRVTVEQGREAIFPLSAFTGGAVPPDPAPVDLGEYHNALAEADRNAAALAPVFEAVLAVPRIAATDTPIDCPVCATPLALTPERLNRLRSELRRGSAVETAAQAAIGNLTAAVEAVRRVERQVESAVPPAGAWGSEEAESARQQMVDLGLDEALLAGAITTAAQVRSAASEVREAGQVLTLALNSQIEDVRRRGDTSEAKTVPATERLLNALRDLYQAGRDAHSAASNVCAVVKPAVSNRTVGAGLTELLAAVEHSDDLATEVRRAAARSAALKRLADADEALKAAIGAVLDRRFNLMSDSISRWWLTIRPEELVSFDGVQRRAGGATFVNLMASLRTDPTAEPVKRHALGIFSDSQLNALGLSTFLARTELQQSSIVILDDPIPGSDGDHRFTFAQNTLEALVQSGIQVILTTYDDKLARLAAGHHAGPGLQSFELTLTDHVAGAEVAPTTNAFDQLMLEAEDNVNSTSAKGRRAASNLYRTAAERLAKQIIATARTAEGVPTTVSDVEKEASQLGKLVSLIRNYAMGASEKGKWATFGTVLNPGSHDDDVPSHADLKQIRGNLRKIAKDHRSNWQDGLRET
jgi:hypothetical protein